MNRPERMQIKDELGRSMTLAGDRDQFEVLGNGRQYLFLGLGPEPCRIPELFPGYTAERPNAFYIECPDFESQQRNGWKNSVPENLSRAKPSDLSPVIIQSATVVLYRPNLKLFPSFWGPLKAKCDLALGGDVQPKQSTAQMPEERKVLLPGSESDLLMKELAQAFASKGLEAEVADPGADPGTDPKAILANGRPELFFSVNFKGLDPAGETAFLLREAGTKVAVWCVDNPFHLLTGVKSRHWTKLDIFVTDRSFIPMLVGLGAERVHYLPLAAGQHMFKAKGDAPEAKGLDDRLVFVGRSEFPKKDAYFAGCDLPEETWTKALEMLDAGQRPDFKWWLRKLGIETLWPGNQVRDAGYCAEESGRAWRTVCLREAGENLTVMGDGNWKSLLPECSDLRPPVDYYSALPDVYRNAACCLNMTSMLLPEGLTQRHFDVWAAGGLLMTDATPGLDLFPKELTREIHFNTPGQIPLLFQRMAKNSDLRRDLCAAWQKLIAEEHTYEARAAAVLDMVGL